MPMRVPADPTPEDIADATAARFLARRGIRRAFDEEQPWDTFAFALGNELMYESIRELVIEVVTKDRAARPHPAVVIRDGECFENDQVAVYCLDFLSQPRANSDYTEEDLDRMVEELSQAGFEQAAATIRDWR